MLSKNPIVRHWQEMLDPENHYKWLNFMDEIHAQLPLILRVGKPKTEDIENCIIGQSGFKSWKEMVEAPQPEGFGWNYSTFDAWKRAYKLVLEHAYLRELELTASQINTIYRESKPNFPQALDEFNAFSEVRKQKQLELHQNSLKDAQNRNKELESNNKDLEKKLEELDLVAQQLQEVKQENQKITEENIRLKSKNDDRVSEITILHEKIAELTKSNIELEFKIKNPPHQSWLKRFLSLFH
jgi:hypothetical protein